MVIKETNVEKIETVGTRNQEEKVVDHKTKVTSVSVSKEFQAIIDENNLSPTEIFRRGVAVMCHDLNLPKFSNELNENRSNYVKEFMERIEKHENLKKEFEKFEKFEKMLDLYNKLKTTMEEITNEI